MISNEMLKKYWETYPDSEAGYEMAGGPLTVWTEDGEHGYQAPRDETDEIFYDRLKRSKKAGRNLFYEEWKPFTYKEGCLY